jgi:hypothetical protein
MASSFGQLCAKKTSFRSTSVISWYNGVIGTSLESSFNSLRWNLHQHSSRKRSHFIRIWKCTLYNHGFNIVQYVVHVLALTFQMSLHLTKYFENRLPFYPLEVFDKICWSYYLLRLGLSVLPLHRRNYLNPPTSRPNMTKRKLSTASMTTHGFVTC